MGDFGIANAALVVELRDDLEGEGVDILGDDARLLQALQDGDRDAAGDVETKGGAHAIERCIGLRRPIGQRVQATGGVDRARAENLSIVLGVVVGDGNVKARRERSADVGGDGDGGRLGGVQFFSVHLRVIRPASTNDDVRSVDRHARRVDEGARVRVENVDGGRDADRNPSGRGCGELALRGRVHAGIHGDVAGRVHALLVDGHVVDRVVDDEKHVARDCDSTGGHGEDRGDPCGGHVVLHRDGTDVEGG